MILISDVIFALKILMLLTLLIRIKLEKTFLNTLAVHIKMKALNNNKLFIK